MFGSEDWICMFGSEDCSDAESVCMAMVAVSWDTTESELVVLGQLGLQWLVVVILQILWRGSRVLQVERVVQVVSCGFGVRSPVSDPYSIGSV